MAKTIGVLELATAVATAFDEELRKPPFNTRYMPAAKWKRIGFTSAQGLGPFLGAVQAILRARFKPAASKLKINPGASELAGLYGQPVSQSVIYVSGLLMAVLAASSDAKLL